MDRSDAAVAPPLIALKSKGGRGQSSQWERKQGSIEIQGLTEIKRGRAINIRYEYYWL